MSLVCFEKPTLSMYGLLLIAVTVYIAFYSYSIKVEPISYSIKVEPIKIQEAIPINEDPIVVPPRDLFRERLTDPLAPPETIYTGDYDSFRIYQPVGFLSDGTIGSIYQVFARRKYYRRSDKMTYYTIDQSRRSIKIPFKTHNDDELYDGDTVTIPILGDLTFTKYDNDDNYRYNPFVI
jgi:hypothetical protein